MSFLKRFRKAPEVEPTQPPQPFTQISSRAKGFFPPPPRAGTAKNLDPKVERLEQQRTALEAAIEAVERSADPESPFQQRIALLSETLETIESEIAAATPLQTRHLPALPATPIEHLLVTLEPVPRVRFSIGLTEFEYAEEIDWAERGTQIVRGDLMPVEVEIAPLIPPTFPDELLEELKAHLDRSLFAFATDLRDRSIEGKPLPSSATLADLATICPRSGDWQLWGGVCLRCLEHDARLRDLSIERTRVLDERTAEIEERQQQVEELPIQRRSLAQTVAEIQALQS